MALNVETIKGYIDEKRLPLIGKAILGAKSADLFNLQTGVKHSAALNLLNTTVEFGDGSECGWDEAGETELTQRQLEVANLKVNMSFCDRTLLDTWAGYEVKVAAGRETLPFEEKFIEDVIKHTNAQVETLIWQGDKSNAGEFDGILTILASETPISAGATGVTDTVTDVYMKIPVEILNNATIVMGEDKFREYVLDITKKNLYHYDPKVDGEMTVVMPGTSTKVIGVPGLNGTDKVIAGDLSNNFFYGTDMANDTEVFDFWYSKDNQEFRLAIKFNAGVQVAFPDQIVLGTIA